MDGQRPEPEGLDLRNFLKSDSGDAGWVRANWGRNWRGLENVFSLLQRRYWIKVWEDKRYVVIYWLLEKRYWDIYAP